MPCGARSTDIRTTPPMTASASEQAQNSSRWAPIIGTKSRRPGCGARFSKELVLGTDLKCSESGPSHPTQSRCNPNLGILKDGRTRSAAAVRKRIHPALAIVCDEPPDGHGLHRIVGDANEP